MSWKFWAKKKDEPQLHTAKEIDLPTDLYAFSVFAGALFARNVVPFDDWREPTIDVPTPLNSVFKRVAQGFQVWVWTVLVNDKYGSQASRLALDVFCLQAARERGTPDARALSNFVVHAGTVAARAAKTAVIDENQKKGTPWTHFAAIDMLVSIAEQPYYNKTDGKFDGNEVLLSRCIAHATDRASVVFDVMLRNVSYTPDKFVEWLWSTHPGGYERHLQRRWNNPLFPPERRKVTAADVYHAWIKDSAAMDELEAKVNTFLKAQPDDLPLNWTEWCNDTRAKVDELLDEPYKIGGNIGEIVSTLQYVRSRAIATWKAGLASDQKALEALEHAEEEMKKWEWLRNDFVQQSTNPDYIPLDDLLPALLSEPAENIRAYCAFLVHNKNEADALQKLTVLRNCALDLVRSVSADLLGRGEEIPDWNDKLDALGTSFTIAKG
jgi:hypothetical protein